MVQAPEVRLGDLRLHCVGHQQVHDFIETTIRSHGKAPVLNLNVHCVCIAWSQPWLTDFINRAPMVFCDGDGVRWGLQILGEPVPVKITYDRWVWQLSELAAEKGWSFYFLGGKPGVAEEAATRLRAKYPALKILGVHHGHFDHEGAENNKIVSEINRLKPNILIVGFGMPLQEKWLMKHGACLDVNIFLTGGAVFDYASGRFKRAPEWMIRYHLEWLFRMLYDPRRLFKRYVLEIPYFFWKIFTLKLKNKK